MVGTRFGRLVVVAVLGRRVRCQCDCGSSRLFQTGNLRNGKSRSCGCLQRELVAERSRRHGHSRREQRTGEYRTWAHIKGRCLNPTDKNYKCYGARGIMICDRWRESFDAFYTDMGPRPSAQHSIDRIDNTGNYSPDNCRWATKDVQAKNRSITVWLTHDGTTLCMTDWARHAGITRLTLYKRLQRGWTLAEAISGARAH